ncbi:MAG TPA: serine acetyltransferase [Bacteroidales bacterium]|nr:serine acetyltransferase [Bacteroidales bacterium]
MHKNKNKIRADVKRWLDILKINQSIPFGFVYLIALHPEYRNLFYYRIGPAGHILNIICPKMPTIFLWVKDIGEGLFIQHGYGIGITAESIGKNCWINQHVSIGYYNNDCPTILDNVTIRPGAVIIGKVTIGNNAVIGINATVVTDVPDNCTVFNPPSKIIKWSHGNGNEVFQEQKQKSETREMTDDLQRRLDKQIH